MYVLFLPVSTRFFNCQYNVKLSSDKLVWRCSQATTKYITHPVPGVSTEGERCFYCETFVIDALNMAWFYLAFLTGCQHPVGP